MQLQAPKRDTQRGRCPHAGPTGARDTRSRAGLGHQRRHRSPGALACSARSCVDGEKLQDTGGTLGWLSG
ncbi:unnamed protein product [Boreogadus saida]